MKLCLGTVQFGMAYGIQENGRPQKEKIDEMLSYALEHGIDLLDTASAYGEAETVLGDYNRNYSSIAKETGVVSKLHPDAFKDQQKEYWPSIVLQNAEESLKKLGVKKLAAYLFHNASYIYDEDAVNALCTVKKSGLTDKIGVSIYTPDEAMKALEYSEIDAIQIPYNVFDHRLDHYGFFDKAKEKSVTVFARSSLLQGLIMMTPDNLPQKVSFAKSYLEQFLTLCKRYDMDSLTAAVGYVGGKDGIEYVVFGVDNLIQLKQYISIQDVRLPVEMISDIESLFDHVEERLVNPVLWNEGK